MKIDLSKITNKSEFIDDEMSQGHFSKAFGARGITQGHKRIISNSNPEIFNTEKNNFHSKVRSTVKLSMTNRNSSNKTPVSKILKRQSFGEMEISSIEVSPRPMQERSARISTTPRKFQRNSRSPESHTNKSSVFDNSLGQS